MVYLIRSKIGYQKLAPGSYATKISRMFKKLAQQTWLTINMIIIMIVMIIIIIDLHSAIRS